MQALIGESFSRLDPLAQQVMQALAVYPVPVPPVAVDFLLQPYQSGCDQGGRRYPPSAEFCPLIF